MIIKINDDYSIDIDAIGNHTLIKKQVIKEGKNSGETRDVTIGYYTSTASAIKKLINLEASNLPDMDSLGSFYKAFKELTDKTMADLEKATKRK